MRISTWEDSGNRSAVLQIGLEAVNTILRDIRQLAIEADVIITSQSNLGELMEKLGEHENRGFGGHNISIFPRENA